MEVAKNPVRKIKFFKVSLVENWHFRHVITTEILAANRQGARSQKYQHIRSATAKLSRKKDRSGAASFDVAITKARKTVGKASRAESLARMHPRRLSLQRTFA